MKTPKEVLRHHVTGAIERGEGTAITEVFPSRLSQPLPRWDHPLSTLRFCDEGSAEAIARAAGWTHGGDCGGFWFHYETWGGDWKAAASWSGTEQEPENGETFATLTELMDYLGGPTFVVAKGGAQVNAPFTPGTALARRKTVEDIVRLRNQALQLFEEAHHTLSTASAALEAARQAAKAAGGGENRYNQHQRTDRERNGGSREVPFSAFIEVASRDTYMAGAKKMIDTECWAHVIQLTALESMMDKTAKDAFNQQLLADPPEFTLDNVLATLDQFALDAGTIWRRGIAKCFSSLDRRFRSHDGWKIGSRIILTYVFNEYGSWNYNRNHRDTFTDIERVFGILDGRKATEDFRSLSSAIEQGRGLGSGARQTVVETDYFLIRAWKNGNAHIWFKRDDLLERVNQLLGEYYAAPIPEDREPDEADPLAQVKTTPAKRYGAFFTPEPAVQRFLQADHGALSRRLLRRTDEPGLRILEPSAGSGNLARAALARPDRFRDYHLNHDLTCVEIQPALAAALSAEGLYRRVINADFLQLKPETTGLFDIVLMNPPFDRERDIDHVMHALTFLKPDGILAAIMSAGTEFRDTKKAKAFRAFVNARDATWVDMPEGSFAAVGTYVNTGALYISNDGRRYGRAAFPEDAGR